MSIEISAAIPVIMGYIVHKLYVGRKRDRGSVKTPAKFNLKFWLEDNLLSALGHMAVWWTLIHFTQPAIDFLTQYKHTPNEIKDVVDLIPTKIVLFVGGYCSAWPFTVLEKKLRPLKNRFGLAKGK